MVCTAVWRGFSFSFLVAWPLGLSCGFSPTSACGPPIGVCSQGCPGAQESTPARGGCGSSTVAGVTGALAATGMRGSWRPQAQESRPQWGPFLIPSHRRGRASPIVDEARGEAGPGGDKACEGASHRGHRRAGPWGEGGLLAPSHRQDRVGPRGVPLVPGCQRDRTGPGGGPS